MRRRLLDGCAGLGGRLLGRGPALLLMAAAALLALALLHDATAPSPPPSNADSASAIEVGTNFTRARVAQRMVLYTGDTAAQAAYSQAMLRLDVLMARLEQPLARPPALRDALARLCAEINRQVRILQRRNQTLSAGLRQQVAAMIDPLTEIEATSAVNEAVRDAVLAAEEAVRQEQQVTEQRHVAMLAAALALLLGGIACMLGRNVSQRQALLRLRAEAARSEQARTRFLASASHDLRQPLHAINMLIGALHRRLREAPRLADEPVVAPLFEGLNNATASMERLFGALLDLSRLEAGTLRPEWIEFDLADLLDGLGPEYRSQAEEKGLTCRIERTSLAVRSDPALLERMLRNLLGNALRYTERGGISLTCRPSGNNWVLVEITDSGPGIPAEQRDIVFEEFQRLANAPPGGLGLGLAIVRRLAVLLGIGMTLSSSPGSGSVFLLRIPAAKELAPPMPRPADAMAGLPGARVVLVERDPLMRTALRLELADLGLLVDEAGSLEELLEAMRHRGRRAPPVLAVIDEQAVARVPTPQLLAWHFGAPVPVLVITATTDPVALRERERAGVAHVIKPVSPAMLRAAVIALVRQESAAVQAPDLVAE